MNVDENCESFLLQKINLHFIHIIEEEEYV
jgi:hypothetical protein